MKLYISKKQLKNSQEISAFFNKKKAQDGIIKYKGGYAIVRNKRVVKIYVGKDALENAKKDK